MSLNPAPPFVLVVEDDQGCSELITEVVTDLGYQVVVRENAEEAQTLLREQRPLLVVLDIMLPDADGFTVLRAMRENPGTETTPVMLCTAALFEVSELHNPVIDPHTEIMPKPFHIDAFVSVMERLIAGR
ncbi:MAG TPA: response regulator [Chloroflexota bacterium]|nr:response regulator [Chloroflexota bacterium]